MPLVVAGSGFLFNVLNAYVNARFISHLVEYGVSWLYNPCFVIGAAIFVGGILLNQHSDSILLNLRKQGTTGYVVPDRGAFRYVSCRNYLGEILEWMGWAIATWSPGGLAFCVYTVANLFPRARSNHRWYRERFKDYPAGAPSSRVCSEHVGSAVAAGSAVKASLACGINIGFTGS